MPLLWVVDVERVRAGLVSRETICRRAVCFTLDASLCGWREASALIRSRSACSCAGRAAQSLRDSASSSARALAYAHHPLVNGG